MLFSFFSQQGKDTRIPSAHNQLTYIFCSPYWFLLSFQIFKSCEFIMYGMHVFALVRLLELILWSNQWITKWWANFKLECLLLIITITMIQTLVICKPRTLNIQKMQKYCCLAEAFFCFCLFVCLFICLFVFYQQNSYIWMASMSLLEAKFIYVTCASQLFILK